jgi:hypothetical protein
MCISQVVHLERRGRRLICHLLHPASGGRRKQQISLKFPYKISGGCWAFLACVLASMASLACEWGVLHDAPRASGNEGKSSRTGMLHSCGSAPGEEPGPAREHALHRRSRMCPLLSHALPRTGSPDCQEREDCHEREDALLGLTNPCSYRARGGAPRAGLALGWDDSPDDDEPAQTQPKTRFTSKGHSEGLTEGSPDPEPPPRRRSDVAAPKVVAEKPRGKTVRWSPHLVTTRMIEDAGSRAGAECSARSNGSDDVDEDDRPPRLPSAALDLSKPRLPRGAAVLLRGAGQAAPRTASEAGRKGINYMEQLAEVGLLTGVWPAQRVLMGMCVSRLLARELVVCPSVIIPVRPGGDIPALNVLQKLAGSLLVCAEIQMDPPKPSERTRSIKSFMKSLLEEDDVAATAATSRQPARGLTAPPAEAPQRKGEGLPISKLRAVRHRIHELDLARCRVGMDGGVALSSLLYTPQYRNARCSRTGDMAALTRLNLARNHITAPPALFAAVASLPNLAHLDLSHNLLGPAGSKALAAALAKYPNNHLRTLDLSDNVMADEGFGALCRCGCWLGMFPWCGC